MAFLDVFLGEPRPCAADYERHFRSGALALLDPGYASVTAFGAGSWPTYVIADADGNVVEKVVGLYRGLSTVKAALEKVSAEKRPPFASAVPAHAFGHTGPRIAADGRGGAWVVYASRIAGQHGVWLERHDGQASSARTLVAGPKLAPAAPDLAVTTDGTVWVAFTAINPRGGRDVFACGVKDGEPGRVEPITRTDDDAMRPAVCVAGDGSVWITYYAWNSAFGASRDRDVFAKRFDGKTWSKAIRVSPAEPAVDDHADPAIVADPEQPSRVWIAWSWDYHSSLEGNDLEADQPTNFVRAVGPGGPAEAVHPILTPGGRHAIDLRPRLGVGPDGVVHCAYDSWSNDRRTVRLAAPGEDGFEVQQTVALTAGMVGAPTTAVAANGDVLLVWMAGEPGAPTLRSAVRRNGHWSNLTLGAPLAGAARYPAAAAESTGGWWVAAEVADEKGSRVKVIRVGP